MATPVNNWQCRRGVTFALSVAPFVKPDHIPRRSTAGLIHPFAVCVANPHPELIDHLAPGDSVRRAYEPLCDSRLPRRYDALTAYDYYGPWPTLTAPHSHTCHTHADTNGPAKYGTLASLELDKLCSIMTWPQHRMLPVASRLCRLSEARAKLRRPTNDPFER